MSQQQEQQISKEKLDELIGKNKKEDKIKSNPKRHHNLFFNFLSNLAYVCGGFVWDYGKAFVNLFIPNKYNNNKKKQIKIIEEPKHEKKEETALKTEASPATENNNDSEQFNSTLTFKEEENSSDDSLTSEPIVEFPPEDNFDTEDVNMCCTNSFPPTNRPKASRNTL